MKSRTGHQPLSVAAAWQVVGFLAMLGYICCWHPVYASDTVRLENQSEGQDLQADTGYFRDPDGLLKYPDVTRKTFETAGEKGLNFGFTRDAFWYRITLVNPADSKTDSWVIEIAWPPLDFLDLYIQRNGRLAETRQAGDQRPPGSAGMRHRNFSFPIKLQPGEQATLYLRAQIDGAHQLPMKAWSQPAFFEWTANGNMALGMFYGVILVMLIYNLLIFLGVRDRVYPYYLLFLIGIAGVLLSLDGFLYPLLWSIAPSMINPSISMLVAAAVLAMLMFVRVSLQTQAHTPKLDRVLKVAAGFAAICTLLPLWMPIKEITSLNAGTAAVMTILTAITVVVQALDGRRVARFYGVVWAALLIGIFTKVLQVNGALPVNFFTVYAIHIGICFLVTLLSLALVDQINTERRERGLLAKEALQAESSARNAILGRMSHELRTPMNAIIGFTDLALREQADTRRRDYLRHIDQASRGLLRLINDVLDFSRFEAGALRVLAEPFALQPLLEQVLAPIRPRAEGKGLRLLHHIDPELPPALVGDAARIEQVLLSLLDNAIKFTRQGEVELSVQMLRREAENCQLEFTVRDSGSGMSPEQLANLHMPLAQGDESMTRSHSGIGIGLTLNRRLIELMGGKLQVDSSPEVGSTFSFALSLPIATDSASTEDINSAEQPVSSSATTTRLGGMQVLLVEDNALNQRLASEILTSAGVLLDMAEDGLQGVEQAKQQAYDLILMDLQMPVMDGLEATRQIRQLPGHESTPIVAMTANTSPQDRADAQAAGMNGFLPKPIEIRRVMAVLQRWAPAAESDDEAEFNSHLAELVACVDLHDFKAQGLCEALRTNLETRFGQQAFNDLSNALQGFDFDTAKTLLQTMNPAGNEYDG